MKININILLFFILITLERYNESFKVNFFVQIITVILLLMYYRYKISKTFISLLVPIMVIFFIGFFSSIKNLASVSGILKDISYFLKPIISLTVSYLLIVRIKNKNVLFFDMIFIFALFTSIIHLFKILFFADIFTSLMNSRKEGLDNFIEIFGLYLLFFHKKIMNNYFSNRKSLKLLSISVFILSIYFYFSRTMLITFVLVGLSFFGYLKITKPSIKIITMLGITILIFFIYLNSIKFDRNSSGIDAFLYKIKIAPEEVFKAKINRINHKELWDHWRGYEMKQAFVLMNDDKWSYVFGTGFGSWINLKFWAPVSNESMKYISRIHNGYVFVLYKTGIFGLIFYLYFLLKLYLFSYKKEIQINYRMIASIGVFFILTSFVISGIYNSINLILFLLGGCLSLQGSKLEG